MSEEQEEVSEGQATEDSEPYRLPTPSREDIGWLLVGGDTRTMVTYFFDSELSWGASDFLRERRGAPTVTVRGLGGKRFLVAGGFNIAAQGTPALRTMASTRFETKSASGSSPRS